MKDKPIYVTQPALPPLDEFIPYLEQIWQNKILTNNGPFHQQLEQSLADYLGVKFVSLFTNGTLALMTALQALRISGEVITTPYSFVATTHALKWNGIEPVFVDIDPNTCNLDPAAIEAAITPQTTAIMPVHVYGIPCNIEAIQRIAEDYNLKVIYDAAHSFGAKINNTSLCAFGDMSILSFHATKVFNTFEGGAIICHDAKTKAHIDHLKNFGFVNETTVLATGINGKMSEINAAFGLLQLQHIDDYIAKRKNISEIYTKKLSNIAGISIIAPSVSFTSNYSYFPILVKSDYMLSRDDLYDKMRDNKIMARRYFYPLISEFPMYRGLPSAQSDNLMNAKFVSDRILCLPLHTGLTLSDIDEIVGLIKNV